MAAVSSTSTNFNCSPASSNSSGNPYSPSGVPNVTVVPSSYCISSRTPTMMDTPNNRQQQQPLHSTPKRFPVAISPEVKIDLENAELWRRFHEHSTEMIVTKTGRRMFPTLRYRLTGLDPNATYAVMLELDLASDCRYKFQNGQWVVAGRADPPPIGLQNPDRCRSYTHPDSPAPGRIWMRQALSFHKIKLTNNVLEPGGNAVLNSMHKYQPRVVLVRLHDFYPSVPQVVASATFPETAFIAVTAYQNEKVIQLKIDHNPFAKGFRDNGGSDRKRPLSRSSCETGRENELSLEHHQSKRPSLSTASAFGQHFFGGMAPHLLPADNNYHQSRVPYHQPPPTGGNPAGGNNNSVDARPIICPKALQPKAVSPFSVAAMLGGGAGDKSMPTSPNSDKSPTSSSSTSDGSPLYKSAVVPYTQPGGPTVIQPQPWMYGGFPHPLLGQTGHGGMHSAYTAMLMNQQQQTMALLAAAAQNNPLFLAHLLAGSASGGPTHYPPHSFASGPSPL